MDRGDTSSARVRAAEVLLNRGWGRTPLPLVGDVENPLFPRVPGPDAEKTAREIIDNAPPVPADDKPATNGATKWPN